VLAAACGSSLAGESTLTLSPAQVKSLGLRTQAAEGDQARSSARYPATVTIPASQQQVVAAALPGMVEALRASVGDTVRAGQVLGVVRSAQAQELQHDVHVAKTQAALTAMQLQRDEQLFKEGLIAASRLENTRTQAGLAQEQSDERALALAQAGGSAHGETTRITLKSPMNGVILERPVVLGQRIDSTTAIYRLASLAPLWLEMQVPAAQATSVRIGDAVSVAGNPASGRVIAIGHAVDAASQTVLVRAEVRQPPPTLRAGQALEAQLARSEPGLTRVPSAALFAQAGTTQVFVDAGQGRYEMRAVEAVSNTGGVSSVRGLAAGSPVVVQGIAALKAVQAAQRP
jgi:RND family efflux transporter MFP subunit